MPRITSAILAVLVGVGPLAAATWSGTVFEDLDSDGIHDPGEAGIEGVTVRLYGTADGGGTVDETQVTDASGVYTFDVPDGCYLTEVEPPAGTRFGPVRADCPGDTPEPFPVGERRTSSGRNIVDHVQAGSFLHYALGDSIAAGESFCIILGVDSDYHKHVQSERMRCVLPSAVLQNHAVGGHTTSDLLRGSSSDGNTVLQAVAADPDLVSISIGGNDFLAVDPGSELPGDPASYAVQEQCGARAMAALRANAQEILSGLVSGLPDADVEFNTVYDNEAATCSGTDFHDRWVPVAEQVIRDLAWGQARRVTVAEVYPDYAHESVQGTDCCGFQDMICSIDGIHPNAEGRRVHENRFWESLGGVLLGPKDTVGSSVQTADQGVLRLVDTRLPTQTRDTTAGGVAAPDDALTPGDDAGAMVPVDGSGAFYVEGFDAEPRGMTIEKAVVGVRYRGVGNYVDDLYWIEASFDPAFPAQGETVSTWNTIIPIVGASENDWSLDFNTNPWSCNAAGRPGSTRLLLDPSPPDWRTVTALLTKNVTDENPPSGVYEFPRVDFPDLGTLSVRLRSRVLNTPDDFHVEWDGAWVDLYGTLTPVPDFGAATKEALDGSGTPVSQAAVDDVLTYRIAFRNDGTATAHGVELADDLDPCLEFVSGPLLDGAPAGSYRAGRVTVPVGDVPAGASHEVTFQVRVTAACAGSNVLNSAVLTSAEDPGGTVTDDPATGALDDPSAVTVPGAGPLTALWTPGLLSDPTPGDPFDCALPRLDPVRDVCSACTLLSPGSWRISAGAALEGGRSLRLYEVPGSGCTTEGDAERLCVRADGARDLYLTLADAALPCP